jgi:hypothetical protein
LHPSSAGGPPETNVDRESCARLLCAVIALAIRDLEKIWRLESKPTLTEYEGKKLARLSGEWRPEAFLEGEWFEEICMMLQVQPDTIRSAVRERRNGRDDWPTHQRFSTVQ